MLSERVDIQLLATALKVVQTLAETDEELKIVPVPRIGRKSLDATPWQFKKKRGSALIRVVSSKSLDATPWQFKKKRERGSALIRVVSSST
jgi:hypothetical protein